MLTDAQVEALAWNSLMRATGRLSEVIPPDIFTVEGSTATDIAIVHSGISGDGNGWFSCRYAPFEAAKKIVIHCDGVYDDFLETSVAPKALPGFEEQRLVAVGAMADCGVLHLVFTLGNRLRDTIDDDVEDSYVVASGMAVASVVGYLRTTQQSEFFADAKPEIDRAVQRAAAKRRALLELHIAGLPHLIAKPPRGAPRKSKDKRKREAQEYGNKVEAAYRRLRVELGKPPTKTSVAKDLGEGGINLKSGIDSSLSAFRNKLTRLGIDYSAITKRVEAELNTNS